jgi:N,N'-diacetyllegionaminate synthase
MKTLIIAEAGVNHNGDIEIAKKLIDVAAEAGADLVKFQTFSGDRLATSSAKQAEYQIQNTDIQISQRSMLKKLELDEEEHKVLINHCESAGISFFSTGFDIESVNLLIKLGQKRFKIPSGEITNLPLLRHIGKQGKEVILSTGMSTLDEVGKAIQAIENAGTSRESITVLQCTTAYPTPIEDVNLRAMRSIGEKFNVSIGYSDHTAGIETSIAAVALGAKIIEKHFTLDRKLPGPDHKASLEPSELLQMIRAIRNIELSLGDGIKRLMPSETENVNIARKSIVASQKILAGELFSSDNLTSKRPGNGISPMKWDEVLGTKAKKDFSVDEIISI